MMFCRISANPNINYLFIFIYLSKRHAEKLKSRPKLITYIMEKFEKFELKQQSLILGGELIMSITYSKSSGETRWDKYDTETDRFIYDC